MKIFLNIQNNEVILEQRWGSYMFGSYRSWHKLFTVTPKQGFIKQWLYNRAKKNADLIAELKEKKHASANQIFKRQQFNN